MPTTSPIPPVPPAAPETDAPSTPKSAGPFKIAYRIVRWTALAIMVLALILVAHKSPAPNLPYDANAAASAQQKFTAAGQTQASGQPAQVQLDPNELNSFLQHSVATEGSAQSTTNYVMPGAAPDASEDDAARNQASPSAQPSDGSAPDLNADTDQTLDQVQSNVKDFKVDMAGDIAKIYVVFDFHGKDMSLELDGHISAENGYLKFDPVAGKLGSMPLPQSTLQAAVDKLMSSPENREKLRLPPDVSGIQIVDGQVVLSYKPDSTPQQ
jgi:hypothetical protein